MKKVYLLEIFFHVEGSEMKYKGSRIYSSKKELNDAIDYIVERMDMVLVSDSNEMLTNITKKVFRCVDGDSFYTFRISHNFLNKEIF